jgi:hypothetical protein
VFQGQQPQQRVDRHRQTSQPLVEQRPPRRDEALVIQVGVDAGEFLGQQQFPDRGLRVTLAQHQ